MVRHAGLFARPRGGAPPWVYTRPSSTPQSVTNRPRSRSHSRRSQFHRAVPRDNAPAALPGGWRRARSAGQCSSASPLFGGIYGAAAHPRLVAVPLGPLSERAHGQIELGFRRAQPCLPTELHAALGFSAPRGRSAAGPSPGQELTMLESLVARGVPQHEIEDLLDFIAANRARAAVSQGTGITYSSHQRMIHWACSLFGEAPAPASEQLIRRVTCLVNSHSTLRGWLAAWKDMHTQRGMRWAGDDDQYLTRMRKGVQRLAPPVPTKKRLRRRLLREVLRAAVRLGDLRMGAAILIAYLFGLRVPSELLGQLRPSMLRSSNGSLTIQNLRRKAKPHPCDLTRLCVCASDQFLCWHVWLDAIALPAESNDRIFPMSAEQYTRDLRKLLGLAGVPEDELNLWTTHCARRGSAADVLAAEGPIPVALGGLNARGTSGLTGMLAHGQWCSKSSASHYASKDEMDSHALAHGIINDSESD